MQATAGRVTAPRAVLRWRHRWILVVAVYLVSRVWSTGLLAGWFAVAKANGWRLGNAGWRSSFSEYLNSWDGAFHLSIASSGYPTTLPLSPEGYVLGNNWAFLPVFPAIVRAVSVVTGLPLEVASVGVALVAGAAAAVALDHLMRLTTDHRSALWVTVLFCFGPLAFLLETGYSEGLYLALLFATLAALIRRSYALVATFGTVAAFTRPGILAAAVAIGVHVIVRLRSGDPFPVRERILAVASGLTVTAAGLAWPVIAGIATGVPDAYVQTETAWWATSIGRAPMIPMTPWFRMAGLYLGPVGPVVVVVGVALAVWWLSRRALRRLRPELLAFAWSYCLYLFAVFLPQQSLFRLALLPLAPLAGDAAILRHRRIVLAACLVLQPIAVVVLWSISFP